jgi:hypothetical protein
MSAKGREPTSEPGSKREIFTTSSGDLRPIRLLRAVSPKMGAAAAAAPSPARDQGEVTVQKVVDSKGNAAGIEKHLLAGSP